MIMFHGWQICRLNGMLSRVGLVPFIFLVRDHMYAAKMLFKCHIFSSLIRSRILLLTNHMFSDLHSGTSNLHSRSGLEFVVKWVRYPEFTQHLGTTKAPRWLCSLAEVPQEDPKVDDITHPKCSVHYISTLHIHSSCSNPSLSYLRAFTAEYLLTSAACIAT